MDTIELVKSFGPTPLDELTARVSSGPSEVAEEINRLSEEDLLKVTDADGKLVPAITAEQAESSQFVVALTSKSLRRSFAS